MSDERGLTVLFYPPFDNSENFTDHYYRMMWYLNPLRELISRIIVPYAEEIPTLGAFPYYLDPTIKQMADASGIANAVELVSSKHTGSLENAAKESDVVLVWRVDRGQGDQVPDGPIKPVVMMKKCYLVDHKHARHAGSHYLRLSAEVCNNSATIQECSEKFKLIPANNFSRTGYIYGTGPSLKFALETDLSEGTSIVCNTIVKNKDLMRKVKPPIIAVADPIFHAGCSSYAGEFRRHLSEAMTEFDNCYLIVPMRDYCVYMANLDSSLRPRIIGVPFVRGQMPNLNLYKKFFVTATANVLTLFLIPLAATFFDRTFILGCDGRPLDQDDYFWKHDSSSQLIERMDDIKVAHPAFFDISYNDYYLEHCQVLDQWLGETERQGKPFFSLTPSHIPALKCRQVSSSAISTKSSGGPVEGQVHIISLNQDLTDSVGHPLAYDTQLCSACMQRGVKFISAVNKEIAPDLLQSHPYFRAIFRDRSSVISRITGYREPPAPAVERFRREVEDFVDKYLRTCKPGDKVILYLYTGGLVHVEVLYDIVKARPQVLAHINLFWCSWIRICDEAFSERWTETLRKALLEDRLVLTVPTSEMQREIQEAAQVVLPVAPMPSTTFNDVEAKNALEQSQLRLSDNTEGANFNVLFPSLMRKPKGYDLSISAIRMLGKKQTDASYQCTLRYIPLEDTPSILLHIAQRARSFANIVEGVLRPDEFKRMIEGADIIVLPYQPSEFSNRTSGLLIDALLCGVPVVVQKGTWLGNLVARYDCGALAETASPEAYIKAIELVAANHRQYRENAINAGKKWLDDNSWASLLDFILESPPPLDKSNCMLGPFRRGAHAYIDESAMIAALLVGQTKTGVMIDVGAMHGSALAPFSHAEWRVFAFEPDPTNRKELKMRFGQNPNLTIDGRAVADRIAENMPFYSSAVSPGISSLHPFHNSHKETCTVSTTTIADFIREKDLHYIDYLKIDAEGYDLLILKGVPWDSIKPNVIMCEFEDIKTRSLGYTMHDMARYLTEHGYKVLVSEWHPVIRYGIRHDWHRLVPYPCELDDPNTWGNLIAFRDEPNLQEIANIARRNIKIDKVASRRDTMVTSLRRRSLYRRLVDYLMINYPTIITIGRFAMWSLSKLKRTFLGIGGIAVLIIAGLYIAGALIEPARWYLVGIASALLLLGGGLLALSYARLLLNRFISDQRRDIKATPDLDEREKQAR